MSEPYPWWQPDPVLLPPIVFPRLDRMEWKLDQIMTNISGLQAAAAQISTDVDSAITALNDLSAKVAAGESVSQADVDAITATLTTASTNLDQAVATDDPAPTPPTG